MPPLTGKMIVMESLIAHQVEYLFGNPGTTELPLIDSLREYPQIQYIMALQEAIAVSMADAYAHASGKVGVVNLHVAPRLGNGLGSLYNAWEGHTPLIITAGQQDTRMRLRKPLLAHDLVAMAAPLTKWSVQAETADELGPFFNRAFKVACDPPTGPVFVSLPIDVMDQTSAAPPMPASHLFLRNLPDPDGVALACSLLLSAACPLIVCGDEVASSDAVADLVELAEHLGAAVFAEVLPARLNFPTRHAHFRDRLAHDQRQIHDRIGAADVVLLVGGDFFEEVWYADTPPFSPGTACIQIDPSAYRLGRNYTVECGLLGDIKRTVRELNTGLARDATDTDTAAAQARCAKLAEEKAGIDAAQRERAFADDGNRAMSTARLMLEIEEALPAQCIVSAEAITATPDLLKTLDFNQTSDFLSARGGGIGQGLPSAIGQKLAYPDRPVLCVSGDGSSLYTIQALWSAAHHQIAVVFLILNNSNYRILKLNLKRYRQQIGAAAPEDYPHLDLQGPDIDFLSIAKGFGLAARRVEQPAEVGPALREAFASGKPWLLDVVIDGSV